MNLRRIRLEVAAGAVTLAAAVLAAVGLGLLLYALLKIWLVPPVAAGVSFLAFAALAAIAGQVIKGGAAHPASAQQGLAAGSGAPGLPERVIELARRRPVVALVGGGLLAALALRNPVLIATVVGAVLNRGHGHRR